MIPTRYSKANNKYMKTFDPTQGSKFIQYLYANNLYDWTMPQPLPLNNFEWMTENGLSNWRQFSDQEGKGGILEVDLEHPKELHDLHNDLPLAPERVVVNKVVKLIPTLGDKKNYVLHYGNLKQYLEMGLKLSKIRRGVSFNEEARLKPYIELNTQLRTKATNDFEKYFSN